MISTTHIKRFAIRSQHDRVRPVFVSALQQSQVFGGVVLIIAVRIANSMQTDARFFIDVCHHIETIKGTQQSLCHAHVHIDQFNLRFCT